MKTKPKIQTHFKRTIASLVIAALFSNAAFALPGVGNFTKGAGTISTTGSNMTVNVTGVDNKVAAINWQGFNVANGENVHFNNGASGMWGISVLNVDNSGAMSQINGGITSNGGMNPTSVFLINPAGVSIGATANIATGGAFGVFAGRANTVDGDGFDVSLPDGVKVDVTLNQAPITINSGAVITAGIGSPHTAMNIISSGAATLPYLAGGGVMNLGTNGANGTAYEASNSRLSDATYYLPNGSTLYLTNNIIDGLAAINFGAAPGNLYGLATGTGSAVLTNNTVKSLAGSSSGAALTFLNHIHDAIANYGYGSTSNITFNGVTTIDASSGKKAVIDTTQYSGGILIPDTASFVGVGNPSDSFNGPEFKAWMGRFMPLHWEDTSTRQFNGTNLALTLSDNAMANGTKLITDPENHALNDFRHRLILNLDTESVFKLNLLSDVNSSYFLRNIDVKNTKGFNFNWAGANAASGNNLYIIDVDINSNTNAFNLNAGMGFLGIMNGTWTGNGTTMRVSGGEIDTYTARLQSNSNMIVSAANALTFRGSATAAGTGLTMGGSSARFEGATLTANAGTINLSAGTGNVEMVRANVTNTGRNININAYNGAVNINSTMGTGLIDTGLLGGTINIASLLGGGIGNQDTLRSKTINFDAANAWFTGGGRIEGNQLNLNNQNSSYDFYNASVNYLAGDANQISIVNDKTLTAQGVYAKGNIYLETRNGDLNVAGAIRTTLQNDPYAIQLIADSNAVNDANGTGGNVKFLNSNPGNLQVGSGSNYVIWTGNPTDSNLGGNTPDRKRYNVNYYDSDPDTGDWTGDIFALLYPGAEGNRVYYRNQPTLTIAATAGQSKTYGDADPASFAYTASGGLQPGDTLASIGLTGALDRAAGENAGSYLYGLGTLANDMGYVLNLATGSFFTINPKSLLVSGITANNKVYDGTTAATLAGGVLTGVVGADDVTLSGGTGSFADKNAGNGKTVNITGTGLTGADAGNYVASFQNSTTANIGKAGLTIAAVADTKVVDGSASSSKAPVVTGLKTGDSVSATQTFGGSSVGSQVLTVSYSVNDGNNGNNYVVSAVDAVGTINAAPVVVPPVVAPVQTPVVVRATRVEASNDVSTPTMRADTVLVPTGAGEAAMPSITQAPAAPVVESTSTKASAPAAKDEKKKQ